MGASQHTVEELGARMDALDLWSALEPYNWAVKPCGTVFPYFCTVLRGDRDPVKVRLLMLEGWQTLHDFVRTRVDVNSGIYSSPIEFPHYELVVLKTGEMKLFRHDPGYLPVEASEGQRALVVRILWEAYGVMLRIESDAKLPLRFASEKAVFARVETKPGVWEDRPFEVPEPPPYVERVSFAKDLLQRAKDIPFVTDETLHVDFRLWPEIMTREPRPRCVYRLLAADPVTKATVVDLRASADAEGGLKGLWEAMPGQLLRALVERGRIPGEIKVGSGRVFRFLRPLCLELPFKLSLHDKLEMPA